MYLPFGFSLTPWVKRLIGINLVVYLVMAMVPGAGHLAVYLMLVPTLVLQRPWTLVTYMFVHAGLWHILFNMIGLFFFGPPLESRWGSREFVKYYLLCGLGGAAFSFLFAPHAAVVGASAAVFGVLLAFGMIWPDSPIYIWGILPIKAKWLLIGLVVLQLLSAVGPNSDGIAHFAHLGGFVVGFFYLKFFSSAETALSTQRVAGPSLAGRLRHLSTRARLKVVSGDGPAPPAANRPRRSLDDRRLDEIDRVLDKISDKGMASLTADERKLLDEVSRRYRNN
jgi:rhomboid family protein